MQAGRELDALIAEKVMGLNAIKNRPYQSLFSDKMIENISYKPDENNIFVHKEVPHYSTDISAAWEVVEKIKNLVNGNDGTFKVQWHDPDWFCYWDHEDFLGCDQQASASTAPHAICLAALEAVGFKLP